jgi:transglutaminase-like putative cysteine protease
MTDPATIDSARFTAPSAMIDSSHPAVIDFAFRHTGASESDRAVRLYYAVRDLIRYDPYCIRLDVPDMKASATLEAKRGWCVTKAGLLAASCRALGIPARLGFADVRNHLSTERLRRKMKTDIFYWHGYTEMFLAGKWVKATPAFNIELCKRFRLLPLEFDGTADSLYHPFDAEGNRHMEYVNQRGWYADVPLDEIARTFQEEYGSEGSQSDFVAADFDSDVTAETGNKAPND